MFSNCLCNLSCVWGDSQIIAPRLRDANRVVGVRATQDPKAEDDDVWVCHSLLTSAFAAATSSLPRHTRQP